MRRSCLMAVICAVACCECAMAQQPKLDANSNVNDVLVALQSSGKSVKSFTADVKLDDADTRTGAETTRLGKVWFAIKPSGDPVMHIQFDRKQVGGKKEVPDKIDYLLDDGWLTDRTAATKVESHMQLVPKGEKVNLFQLGKSPFPMPIGQDPAEIQKQFDITKAAPDKDDPADTIHLQLTPKPGSSFIKQFSSVDIWTSTRTNMPVRIETVDARHIRDRTADLSNMKVNADLKPEEISLPPLPPDYRPTETPLQ